jgi:hypothetical protein
MTSTGCDPRNDGADGKAHEVNTVSTSAPARVKIFRDNFGQSLFKTVEPGAARPQQSGASILCDRRAIDPAI